MSSITLSLENRLIKIKNLFIKIFLSGIAIIASSIVYINSYNFPGNKLLFLLPLLYAILLFVFPAMINHFKGHIGLIVLNSVIFVRYVFSPVFRSFFLQEGTFRGYTPSAQSLHNGLIIMIVELFVAFIIVQLFAKRFYNKSQIKVTPFKPLNSKVVISSVLLLGLASFAVFPQLISRYNFFIATNGLVESNFNIPLNGLVILFSDLALILITIILLDYFKKKYDKTLAFRFVLFSLIAVLPNMLFFKGTSRLSVLIPTIAWMIILLKLYPKYKKQLIVIVSTIIITVFLSITLVKQFGYTKDGTINSVSNNEMAYNLDAYFSGPDNMGRAVELNRLFENSLTIGTLFNDSLNNVAVLSRFSDSYNTTTAWFNYLFYGVSGKVDQIIPLSGQSYIHFGALGTPLLLALTLTIMLWFDSKISRENRIEYVYIYVYLVIYMGMAMMLSFGSIYPIFTNLLIPIILIFKLNRKITL